MKNICVISLIVLLAFVGCWAAGYRLNLTRSLPVGLYRITGGPVQRGKLAAFCLEDAESISLARERGYLAAGSCPSGLRPLLKVVSGLAGDVVGLEQGLIAVNGQPSGRYGGRQQGQQREACAVLTPCPRRHCAGQGACPLATS